MCATGAAAAALVRRARFVVLALTLAAAPRAAAAKVYLTQDEALRLAFPDCTVARSTAYLTAEQVAHARELAGDPTVAALAVRYAATCGGRPGGVAYFDTHRVRTLPETLMVVVAPDGSVRRVEVLSFSEPEDYLPRSPFYAQFAGRRLAPTLQPGRDIRQVTGATLTSRATTAAVRRVLAVDAALAAPQPASAAAPAAAGKGPR